MKKLLALVLAAIMLVACCAALAEEGYPEVTDAYDFGGAEVWIADYWSSANWDANTDMTEEQEATYNYRRWIESTFNCTVKTLQDGDWGSNVEQLINFCSAPDGSYRLYILPPDFVATPMANNLFAAWQGDMTDEHWNSSTVGFMTKGGNVYGVSTGYCEPRPCLYFNKRVLEEAGINWESIYDMQAEGTWTWDAFEAMLQQITKDTDNDGVIDIYGMTGSNMDLYLEGVFSNGGTFFEYDENGKLAIACNTDEVIEGMQWAKDIWNNYGYQQPADGQWDYYKTAWKEGFCGFYMYQTYGGFNDNSEMADMVDEWGCVAFPMGKLGNYIGYVSENVTVIPNVYTEEEVAGLTALYKLWTTATPGYDDEDSWIGNKYNYTDERAVEETYAMLRQPEHQLWNKCLFLGSLNDVLGADFMWNLGGSDPAALIEAKTPVWQGLLDGFNK